MGREDSPTKQLSVNLIEGEKAVIGGCHQDAKEHAHLNGQSSFTHTTITENSNPPAVHDAKLVREYARLAVR